METRELSKLELEFIEEALMNALVELEELENMLEWYTTSVTEKLEQAIEVVKGNANPIT